MKLEKKKQLAARVLRVSKERICFDIDRLAELKEAITKQDIKDLVKVGAIKIKEIKGRRQKIKKRKTKKQKCKIKKNIKRKKQVYVKITRKLRKYLKELKKQGKIKKEVYRELRKKIKARGFKNMAQLKDHLKEIEEEKIK